jgi:hypothetical protein
VKKNCLLLLLIFWGTVSASHLMDGPSPANSRAQRRQDQDNPQSTGSTWRRTAHGWERKESWTTSLPSSHTRRLHPLTVAALELLVSLAALLALQRRPATIGAGQTKVLGQTRTDRPAGAHY